MTTPPPSPVNDVGGWLLTTTPRKHALQRTKQAINLNVKGAPEILGTLALEALEGVLHLGLNTVLEEAWTEYRSLVAAARHSLNSPQGTLTTQIDDHDIPAAIHLTIDVHIYPGITVPIKGKVTIFIRLCQTRAELARGRLTALLGGTAQLNGKLTIGETTIVSSGVQILSLPPRFTLPSGVTIAT